MLSVVVNGEASPVNLGGAQKLVEVIELIKSVIDPEHMITGLTMNGAAIDDVLWEAPLTQLETAVLEVETGEPDDFLRSRLRLAPEFVVAIRGDFSATRQEFQRGNTAEANRKLAAAVEELRAFFDWYGSLMELAPQEKRQLLSIADVLNPIVETAKRICQYQLYASWWAVGEAINKDLEPQLGALERKLYGVLQAY